MKLKNSWDKQNRKMRVCEHFAVALLCASYPILIVWDAFIALKCTFRMKQQQPHTHFSPYIAFLMHYSSAAREPVAKCKREIRLWQQLNCRKAAEIIQKHSFFSCRSKILKMHGSLPMHFFSAFEVQGCQDGFLFYFCLIKWAKKKE